VGEQRTKATKQVALALRAYRLISVILSFIYPRMFYTQINQTLVYSRSNFRRGWSFSSAVPARTHYVLDLFTTIQAIFKFRLCCDHASISCCGHGINYSGWLVQETVYDFHIEEFSTSGGQEGRQQQWARFSRFRRATRTPFNLVFGARP
jgi:hypothetical protein